MARRMVKRALALLLCSLVLLFCGCSARSYKPEEVVQDFFSAVRARDFKKARGYLEDPESFGLADEGEGQQVAQRITDHLAVKIVENGRVEMESNTALVTAEVTSVDTAKVVSQLMEELLPDMIQDGAGGVAWDEARAAEEVAGRLEEALGAENLPTKATEVEIVLVPDGATWKIRQDAALIDAMTGGMLSLFSGGEGNLQ
nr:hypothetical protein [Maliibacterium massiliense]